MSPLSRYLKLVVIGAIHIETMIYHYIPIRMAKTIPRACRNAKKQETSYIACKNKNDTVTLENSLEISYKVKLIM